MQNQKWYMSNEFNPNWGEIYARMESDAANTLLELPDNIIQQMQQGAINNPNYFSDMESMVNNRKLSHMARPINGDSLYDREFLANTTVGEMLEVNRQIDGISNAERWFGKDNVPHVDASNLDQFKNLTVGDMYDYSVEKGLMEATDYTRLSPDQIISKSSPISTNTSGPLQNDPIAGLVNRSQELEFLARPISGDSAYDREFLANTTVGEMLEVNKDMGFVDDLNWSDTERKLGRAIPTEVNGNNLNDFAGLTVGDMYDYSVEKGLMETTNGPRYAPNELVPEFTPAPNSQRVGYKGEAINTHRDMRRRVHQERQAAAQQRKAAKQARGQQKAANKIKKKQYVRDQKFKEDLLNNHQKVMDTYNEIKGRIDNINTTIDSSKYQPELPFNPQSRSNLNNIEIKSNKGTPISKSDSALNGRMDNVITLGVDDYAEVDDTILRAGAGEVINADGSIITPEAEVGGIGATVTEPIMLNAPEQVDVPEQVNAPEQVDSPKQRRKINEPKPVKSPWAEEIVLDNYGETVYTRPPSTQEYIDLTTDYKEAKNQARHAVNKTQRRIGDFQEGMHGPLPDVKITDLANNFNEAADKLSDYEIAKGHVQTRRLNYKEKKLVKLAQRNGHLGDFTDVSIAAGQEYMDDLGNIKKGVYKFEGSGGGGPKGPKGSSKEVGGTLSRFNRSSKVRFNTVLSGGLAIADYNNSRREGKTVIESAGSAAFEMAKGEMLGFWGSAGLGLVKAVPKAVVNGYQEVQSVNRSMNNIQRLSPFDGAEFHDTQQLATMRQSGMELAKMANYNLQQTLMGTEARYLHR